LEALSNESARMANRLRSLLPEDQRTLLESALASLAPVLDLRSPHPADSPAEGQGAEVAPALAAGHAVIEELAQQGCERAEALAQAAADGAAQLVAAPAAAAAGEAPEAGGEPAAGESGSSKEQPSAGASPAEQPPAPAALKALAGLHADGVKSVAELCSLCLERLLALGRSVGYFYRSGRPANDGITWPTAPAATGLLLRGQALRLLEELQTMAAAFGAALAEAGGHLDAAAGSKAYAHAAGQHAHALQSDSEAAAARLQDACRSLVQVVWITSVPRDTLEDLLDQ
jgi:hypothetical protein